MHHTLRRLREARSETQLEVARAVGIDRTYYTKIEAGRAMPGRVVAQKLAAYFGTTVEDLFPLFQSPLGDSLRPGEDKEATAVVGSAGSPGI